PDAHHFQISYTPNCIAAARRSLHYFVLYCSGHHRHLHSFPTRRSSDLSAKASAVTSTAATCVRKCVRGTRSRRSRIWRAARGSRSEEHTSELQSRRDLVCRLLLEKKKKKGQ